MSAQPERQQRPMMLPAGRTAEARHLEYSNELQGWTVRCNHCGEDWPCTDEFFARDGLGPSSWCKACRAEKSRNWYRKQGAAARKAARSTPVPDCPQPESAFKPIVYVAQHHAITAAR